MYQHLWKISQDPVLDNTSEAHGRRTVPDREKARALSFLPLRGIQTRLPTYTRNVSFLDHTWMCPETVCKDVLAGVAAAQLLTAAGRCGSWSCFSLTSVRPQLGD